jgi:DNA-binding response OmpR family regulator
MNNSKILIVEDESLVALDIKSSLEELGFFVTGIANSYESTKKAIEVNKPNIILLDINLKKKKSGIDVANYINVNYDIAIIFLTAYSDEKTISSAVESNPTAYLNKPFRLEDLKATILLTLHKVPKTNKELDLGNGYTYRTSNKHITLNNELIKLSQNETKFLELLINAKGNIVLHSDIEEYLWNDEAINNDTLRALVYRTRNKLKNLNIETVPSLGYKLIR